MKAKEVFDADIHRSKRLLHLHDEFVNEGKPRGLRTELLRTSLVMSMASLDAYLHRIIVGNLVRFIKENLKQMARDPNKRVRLSRLEKFIKDTITPFEFLEIMGRDRPYVQFRKKMEQKIFRTPYQSPEGIENAFELFGVTSFWPVMENSGLTYAKGSKGRLEAVYVRRNEIVHGMDRFRSKNRKNRTRPITKDFCVECISLVQLIVRYIERTYWDKNKQRYVFL